MAIPFKTKQVFRELFEFVSSNGKLSADDLRGTNKMFYPPFTDGIVAKHAESCPLTVDGFLGFIAEARQETNAPWDDIVWGYAQNFAKRFVFNNSPQMEMKQLRAVIDPSVRPVKPEPELSALWKSHCGTGQANVAGLVALLKSLVQGGQMQLGAALQAMLPKGKKNAAGLHPAAAGPSSPRRATVTASSPTSPASPKKEPAVPPPPPPRPAPSPKADEKPKTPVAAEPPKAPESAPEEPASPASLDATSRDPAAPTTSAEGAAAAATAAEASPKSPTPPRAMSPNADRAPSPSAFAGAPSPRHGGADLELNASLLGGANPSFAALRSATSGMQQPSAQPTQSGVSRTAKQAQQPPAADKSTVGVTCRLEAEPLPRAVVEVVREIDSQRETLHKLLEDELSELQASTTVVDLLKQRLEALKARKGAATTAADEQKRLEAKMDKFARDVASQQQFLHASISTTLRQQAVDAEHARLAIEMQGAAPYGSSSSGAYYGGADVSAGPSASAVGTFAGTSVVRLQQLHESVRTREQQLHEKEAALRKMRKIEREEQRLLSELTTREQQQQQQLLQQQQELQQQHQQYQRQQQQPAASGLSETPLMARRAGGSQSHADPRYALQPSSVGARDGYVMPPRLGATPAAQAAARGSTGTRSHMGDATSSMTPVTAPNPYTGSKLTRDSASSYLSHRR